MKGTMPEFLQIAQTLGFPVACVIALGWYLKKTIESHEESREKLTKTFIIQLQHANEEHHQERDALMGSMVQQHQRFSEIYERQHSEALTAIKEIHSAITKLGTLISNLQTNCQRTCTTRTNRNKTQENL